MKTWPSALALLSVILFAGLAAGCAGPGFRRRRPSNALA